MREIDTYEYEKDSKEKFGRVEERLLTLEELHDLYFICQNAVENDLRFILGFSTCSFSMCLYKNLENKWVVLFNYDIGDSYIYGIFDNIYDAYLALINACVKEENRNYVIDDFNRRLNTSISREELENCGIKHGYYDKYFYYDFKYTIKKMCGISVDEDLDVNERILNRKDRNFPSNTSFDELVACFINNMARILNIDTSDLDEQLACGKINFKTYDELRMKRINLKDHKELVLKELEKYNQLGEEKIICESATPLCRKMCKKFNNIQ